MEWYEILVMILGGIGGTGGILSLYNAKDNKDTIKISNFERMLNEAQDEREKIKLEYGAYADKMDSKIKELENKIEGMERRLSARDKALNSAYRCTFAKDIHSCPVLKTIEEEYPLGEQCCK